MHDCFFWFLADTALISSTTTLLGLGVGDPSKAPGRLEQIDSCKCKTPEHHQPLLCFLLPVFQSCDEPTFFVSASAPYIIFLCSAIDPQHFCRFFKRTAMAGWAGIHQGDWPVFSWLLLLQDGIYARYFTAGVLVDDTVDGFLFGCGSRAKKNAFGSSGGRNFSRDQLRC
jgi:hypothetical protein